MSASVELYMALLNRLRTDPAITALVSTRTYDKPPASPTYPYITFGAVDFTPDDTDCVGGGEHNVQIDIWSKATGKTEAKRITDAVRRSLHRLQVSLDDFALVEMQVVMTRVLGDPDGATSHGVVHVSALIEEPL